MQKKILITGATGYLGSRIARALLREGHAVIALKREKSSLRKIEKIASQLQFLNSEQLDFEKLFQENKGIDAIIHLATCYGRHHESMSEIFAANVSFPLRLLEAANQAGVKVFLNTDTTLEPFLNSYALSKNQFMQCGKFVAERGPIHFVNIRLEHFYGEGDDETKFPTHVIKSCLRNLTELKLTQGEQQRDFVHIDDVVSAYITLLRASPALAPYSTFDLGTGKTVSIRAFVETVHRLTGSTTQLNFGALPYRAGEVMHSEADTKALSALGWCCRYDILTGLRQVIEQERERT